MNLFLQIETRLQTLVEGGLARLFPGRGFPPDLGQRLVEAMRSSLRQGPYGEPVVPNLYILLLHPAQASALQADQGLLDELTHMLRQAGQEAGLRFSGPPVVRVAADEQLVRGQVEVLARDSQDGLPQTAAVDVDPAVGGEAAPAGAYLVVNGMQVFPLDQPVINIGRRPDNHLVLDDKRVSRQHAQLRLQQGHYMIFDLDSAGGTWVNGERTRQHVLYPGDVISLAGLPLVYGQDQSDTGQTMDFMPGPQEKDQ